MNKNKLNSEIRYLETDVPFMRRCFFVAVGPTESRCEPSNERREAERGRAGEM
jgi:hypothetical protein